MRPHSPQNLTRFAGLLATVNRKESVNVLNQECLGEKMRDDVYIAEKQVPVFLMLEARALEILAAL